MNKGLTHSIDSKREILGALNQCRKLGIKPKHIFGYQPSVPNSYKYTKNMRCQISVWSDKDGLRDEVIQLETRPFGKIIPMHVIVEGAVPTPDGWHCVRRTEKFTDFTL